MKVCVCFKVVEDLEKVVPTDWQEFEGFPDTSYVGKIIGYFDEVALELALRLKDNNEEYQKLGKEALDLNTSLYDLAESNIDLEKLEKLSMDNGIKIYFKEYFDAQKVLDFGFGGFEEDEIEEAVKLFSQIWYKTKSN